MKHFLIYSLFITLSFLVNSCEEGFKDESSVFSLELKELIAINSPTRDTTPDYTFSSNIAGSIKYAGLCSSSTTVASLGANTITLDPLVNGTYSDCSITVESEDIWLIGSLKLSSFIVLDPTAPTIAEVTIVTSPTNDSTPNYTFYSDQAGTITYGGSCSSSTTSAIIGNTTITLVPLSDGTYSDCTINVTNASGIVSDSITITSFVVDSAAATLAEVTAVITPNNDPTPNYTFSSDQAGTITYGGSCSSVTTSAINGNTTITLRSLSDGTYSDCTVTVTDAASNSVTLNMSSFTVDTTAPTVSSFTFSDTDLKTNDTATVTLVFSEAVASFSSYDDITVVNGSLAAMTSNNNITWSGIFTPTANTEDWDNMLWLGTSYTDSVGNTGTVAVTSNYKVDDNDPSVTSFTLSDSALKAGDTPTVTLVFSEKVASFSSADDITVANGTLTTMTSSDDKTWTGTFTPTANTEDANNTFSLATSYTDTVGNTGPTATTANYAVETLAPSVTSFTLSDTVLNAGDTPTLTLVFSEKVASFSSAADITVANGTLSAMSSSDDTTWTGTFTPTANTDDANNILSLASSYTDVAGNTGPTATTANYEVDTIYPTVSSVAITSATGILNNLLNPGDVVSVTANFSESVIIDNTSGTPTLTFVVGSTDQTATYTSGSGGTTLVFKYTIQAGDNDSDGISIGANVLALNSGTIKDVAGNNATLTHSAVSANTSYKADTAAPTASWSAATDNVGTVTGALSSGDTTDDPTIVLSGTNEAGSSVKVYDNTTELGSATVTGTSWSFSATVARATTYQFNVKETDLAGNTSVATSNFALTGDTDSPTVSSVVITSATGILNNLLNVGDVLSVTLTFSKNVLVSGFPQMTLVVGSTDQTSTYTSGSGSTALVFQYTIQAGETDTDGISIGANVLALNSGTLRDAAGNSATLTHSAMPANTSYKVDTTAPTVNTFTLSDTELKIGDNATVTLVLSEAVASFSSAADITVTSGTLATMTSTDNITWSGTFTPTSNIEDASNTLSLATSYTDTAGNAGPAATTSNYEVDTTAPSVNSFTLSDTALKAGDNATVTLEFSETVASFSSSADITVNNGTLATMTSSDNITWTGTFTPTTNTEDASNTLSLATSYTDTAGNGGPAATTANYEVETLVPTVSSVAITSATGIQNNLLNTGDVISFTSTFSENVLVTGFPKITLVVGSTDRSATYTSGSGSTALVFQYTILAGETDTDGISIGANVLALNSGTLRDAAGNNATLTHSSLSANTSYKVDTTAPTATWSAATDNVGTVTGALTSGDTTDDTALILSGTNEAGSSVKIYNSTTELGNATVSGTSWSYTATVANGTTYQFNVKETDLAGNTSVATSNFAVTGDTTAPTANLSAATDNVGNITGTLTTGDTTDDTALVLSGTNESGSSVKVYNGTTELDNATVSGTSWSYTATLVDGTTYQFNVKETDLAGNTSNPTPNFAVTGDTTPPTVSSVAITSATGILNNFLNATDVLSVTITFDENVPVTGTPQLPLVIGADNRTATYTTGSGSTALVFKYTIQAGDTDTDGISIGANVLALNSGTIRDAAGNNATLTHSSVSDNTSYKVDTTAPTVSWSAATDNIGTVTGALTSGDTTDDTALVLSGTNESGSSVKVYNSSTELGNATVSGTSWSYSATVANGTTYQFNVKATDLAGNTSVATINFAVTGDTTAPTANLSAATDNVGNITGTLTTGDTTDDTALVLSGTNESGSSVKVYNGTTELDNATVSGTSWSYTATLVDGTTYQFNVKETDLAGNTSNPTPNFAVTGDTTPPTVSSVAITSATGILNNFLNATDVLSVTITFDENVPVTGTPQLPLVIGADNRTATYTTGSGSTALVFKYTIQAGDTDTDGISIGANVLALNSGTIWDAAGNNAILTHSAVSDNESYMVDTTAPTVNSFTLSDSALKIGENATVSLVFSDVVISFSSAADITAPNGSLTTFTSSDNITWSGTFTPTTNIEDASNTLALGTNYSDPAGNTGPAATTANYEVETLAPTVSSIVISGATGIQNNFLNAGDNVSVTTTFSENVAVTGSPTLTIVVGSTNRTVTYTSGSGGRTLVFKYTIQGGETDTNGISIGTNGLALNSGTIMDAAGNNATLTHSAVSSNSSYKVDTTPPTISSVAITSATNDQNNFLNAGDIASLTTTFSESVNVTDAPQLTMIVGSTDRVSTYTSGSGSTSLITKYTIQAGETDDDGISIGANVLALNSGTIQDPAGNNATLTHSAVSANSSFMVDTTSPTVDSFTLSDTQLLIGETATVGLDFSEKVILFTNADITAPNGTLATMTSSDATTWTGTFTPNTNTEVPSNTLSLGTIYTDLAGNTGTVSTTANYEVETYAPSAIFTIYDTKMKENETSQVDLVFREPVLLFSNSDITFPDLDNGTVSGTLSTMTSSDNITWTGTFSPTFPETQDWTNAFTLASSYTDIVGNTGTAQTSVNFMIDDIEPTTIPTITLADTTHLYRQLVWLTVVFPEPVDPSTFNNSDIDITDANGTLVSSMGSSDGNITWRAYFRPTDNIEDVSNTISLGTAWTDQVGNAGIAAISSNFEVETTIPTADNFTISVAQGTTYTNTSSIDSALKPGDNATLTLVFSEVVNGFSSSTDIVTPNVTLTAMTSSDNITWTGNFTPTDNIADITNTLTMSGSSFQDVAGNNGTSKTSLNFVVDTKAPSASSISPVNNACIPITDNIAVTFDFHMEPSYLTTSTSDTNCAGSMRLSADNFSTCVQMSAEPAASSVKQRFTLNPSDNLSYNTTYNIKVTTAAKSILGNALSTQYDSSFITSLAPSSVSGLFMAVGDDGETLRSDDNGSSWVSTNCQFTNSNDFNAVTFGNNTYVGVGNSGLSRRSTDTGANFSTANTGSGNNHLYGLTFGNNTFVGVGASGHIRRSTDDGASFPSVSSGYGGYLRGVTFGNNIFAAVGQSGKILRSTNNGASWSNATSPITTYLYGVAYGNNTFVAVGKKGKIVRSTDYGASWDNATSPITTYLNGVAFGNNTFVAVGQSGKILRSTDNGASFSSVTSPITTYLYGVAFGNDTFVAVGQSGKILRSTDAGASWNNETSPITTYLRGVTFSE